MASKALKILACGDVEGQFDQIFKRVDSIQKKSGPFDLLICSGEFFGANNSQWEKYASGSVKAPISTLILGSTKESNSKYFSDKEGGELCENITYLGRKGQFTGSSGLQIAYLSGLESPTGESDAVHFNKRDVAALVASSSSDSKFKGIDILLTSQCPLGVEKYSQSKETVDSTDCGSEIVSQVALILKPRYHFSTINGQYFERQPYRNHKVLAGSAQHVTRFISLAKLGNAEKKKYLYAFNITPMSVMDTTELVSQPVGTTECPYKSSPAILSHLKTSKEEKPVQFFYNTEHTEQVGRGKKRQHDGNHEKRPPKKHPQPTGPCWFCLGSAEVEKHLVVSVGLQCYLALAKGGLVSDHVLILPIGHHQSTVSSTADVRQEIEQYKKSLKKCFKAQGKAVVFFERNFRTQHLQIQAVPIPESAVQDVKDIFIETAQEQSFELHEIPKHSDLKQIVPEGVPYFYTELPSGEKLLHRISKGFPLQFGREALVHPEVLNMPERIDWKNCKISKEEEIEQAADFKRNFKPYDFTLV
ncbi:CWF19-like protein 1 [Liolophura sinensis]|uniref:CWF19-like protein 1 n=1 Tax=Liolophura sinensis TaxID=3198878 RepID=UPI003158F619